MRFRSFTIFAFSWAAGMTESAKLKQSQILLLVRTILGVGARSNIIALITFRLSDCRPCRTLGRDAARPLLPNDPVGPRTSASSVEPFTLVLWRQRGATKQTLSEE